MPLRPARAPTCLLPLNNNKPSKKKLPPHSLPPISYTTMQSFPMASLTYAPVYSDIPPPNYRLSAWSPEYFAPQTRHSAYAATDLADSFKGNGILKHHVYEVNNNELPKKTKKKQMSLTWGPQKLRERPSSGKSVKFSPSTWGPASPAPAPRDGEYATINPRKLSSRYVRPAVFRRTTLKE